MWFDSTTRDKTKHTVLFAGWNPVVRGVSTNGSKEYSDGVKSRPGISKGVVIG